MENCRRKTNKEQMREGIKKNGLEDFIGGEKKKKGPEVQGPRPLSPGTPG